MATSCYTTCPDGYALSGSLCTPVNETTGAKPISAPGVVGNQLPVGAGQSLGTCEHCPALGCVLTADGAPVVACGNDQGKCVVQSSSNVQQTYSLTALYVALGVFFGLLILGMLVRALYKASRRRHGYVSRDDRGFAGDFCWALPELFEVIAACFQ